MPSFHSVTCVNCRLRPGVPRAGFPVETVLNAHPLLVDLTDKADEAECARVVTLLARIPSSELLTNHDAQQPEQGDKGRRRALHANQSVQDTDG